MSNKNSKEIGLYELLKAAEDNDPAAQLALGDRYFDGDGVNRDYSRGFIWYSRAEKLGLSEAACRLGWLYLEGLGVEKSIEESIKWYRKGAEQGAVGPISWAVSGQT